MIKYLRITAKEVTKFINQIDSYVSVTITANVNGSTSPIIQTYESGKLLDSKSNFFVTACDLYIKPEFFGLTAFIDGVYNIKISLNKPNGYIRFTNCAFIDVTYKCKVASLLNDIAKENELAGYEKRSTIAHLLHYSLVNGSNCGCNCDELVSAFKELTNILTNIDPKILKDCGC